jgi:hypothetical protein
MKSIAGTGGAVLLGGAMTLATPLPAHAVADLQGCLFLPAAGQFRVAASDVPEQLCRTHSISLDISGGDAAAPVVAQLPETIRLAALLQL